MPGGVRESSCKTDIIEMASKGRALWCHALTKNQSLCHCWYVNLGICPLKDVRMVPHT